MITFVLRKYTYLNIHIIIITICFPIQIMSKWATIRTFIQTKSILQHGSDPNHYSAKASFHFDSFKQGVVLNVNKKKTITGYVLTKKKSKVLLFMQFGLLVICAAALLFEPKTVFLKTCCIFIFVVEFVLFCCFVAVSNKQLLQRIMLKSFLPYIKLYIALVETTALISLLNWSFRALAVAPVILLSQLTIFISDAIFYHFRNKKRTIILIALFLAFRIYLIICVMMHGFENSEAKTITIFDISFVDQGTFISKSIAGCLFCVGQIVFQIRHPLQLYSIRTCYTVLQNKDWNRLERNKRIQKKQKRQWL